jgi:hypothetical protein
MAHAKAVINFGNNEALSDNGAAGSNGRIGMWGMMGPCMSTLRADMDRYLVDASQGKLLQGSLCVAIVGRQNTSK